MRKRLFEIIEVSDGTDRASRIYDIFMLASIFIGILPLAFRENSALFSAMDHVAAGIFTVDYILRFATADFKLRRGRKSFSLYPFTPWAIVDLVSILPSLVPLNKGFRLFRVFRAMKACRGFRMFKAMRYSNSFRIIARVIGEAKEALLAVAVLAAGYIVLSALIIFNVEPQSFRTFFDAVYWATVSLTTVGYGDIYPVTTEGRIVTIVSSLFGIAIVALPAGIITANYMTVLREEAEKKKKGISKDD